MRLTPPCGSPSRVVQRAVALVKCSVFNPVSFGTGGDGRASRWPEIRLINWVSHWNSGSAHTTNTRPATGWPEAIDDGTTTLGEVSAMGIIGTSAIDPIEY